MQTYDLVSVWLHDDLCGIVMGYFQSASRTWKDIAIAGEYEVCISCPDEYLHETIVGAAREGWFHLLQMLLEKDPTGLDYALRAACRWGHNDIVEWLLSKGAHKYNWGMRGACKGGHIELMTKMATFGVTEWKRCIYSAFWNGRPEVIEWIQKNSPVDWTRFGYYGACRGGHLEIVRNLLREMPHFDKLDGYEHVCRGGHSDMEELRPLHNLDLYLADVCCYGNMERIEHIISLGANSWNYGLYGACRGRHVQLANEMLKRGAFDCKGALNRASASGCMKLVEQFLDAYTEQAMYNACLRNRQAVVKRFLQMGSTDFNSGFSGACQGEHIKLMREMAKRGATKCACNKSIADHFLMN